MPEQNGSSPSRFSATFPQRFASALADAQGTIAGITASAGSGEEALLDVPSLARLHELYRLRIELEIEAAGVLWRTAEVVCAMADAIETLGRRRTAAGSDRRLAGTSPAAVEGRRAGTPIADDAHSRRMRWPQFGGQRGSEASAARFGRRPTAAANDAARAEAA